jgi:hypothetical protein
MVGVLGRPLKTTYHPNCEVQLFIESGLVLLPTRVCEYRLAVE